MADNVQITAGSGTVIATDERSIGGTSVQAQRISTLGSSAVESGHVAVTNSDTTIRAATETQNELTIVNYQTVPIYVGAHTVSTTTGFRLDPGASLSIRTTALVCGITAAAYTAAGEDDKVHWVAEVSA